MTDQHDTPPTPIHQNFLWDLDAWITGTIALVNQGRHQQALLQAMVISRYYQDKPEVQVLCAHVLSHLNRHELALEYWCSAMEQNPLEMSWILGAVKTALACQRDDLAVSWVKGVEKNYLTPPSESVLSLAGKLGLKLCGCVGIHRHAVRGWALLGPGQMPALETHGRDQAKMYLSPVHGAKTSKLWKIHIPLELSDTLILHVLDAQANHLCGSPLYCEPASQVAEHFRRTAPGKKAPRPSKTFKKSLAPEPEVTVIVPVYEDQEATLLCLKTLEDSRGYCKTPFEVLVIWDAGPEEKLLDSLKKLAQTKQIRLLLNHENLGFVNSVNRALRHCPGKDVVLLNSDALVNADWLDRLHAKARSQDHAGTITPFTNYGELASYPRPFSSEQVHTSEQRRLIDEAAAKNFFPHKWSLPEIPVGVGFCLYITAALLQKSGGLDSALIHRGYGEEVDFCLRAKALGFRNYLAPDVFVGHLGGRSFGSDKRRLVLQNNEALYALYPDYNSQYRSFARRDPLKKYRQKISLNLLGRLKGPLWIGDTVHFDHPAWTEIKKDSEKKSVPLAIARVDPSGAGTDIRLMLHNTDLPMAEIFLSLPEEKGLFEHILEVLDPDEINVLGPGLGAKQVINTLGCRAKLVLTTLPRPLLQAWRNSEDPDTTSLKDYSCISCCHPGLIRWLDKAYPNVSACSQGWSNHAEDIDPFIAEEKNEAIMACGLNTVDSWYRLKILRRSLESSVPVFAHGLDNWKPLHQLDPGKSGENVPGVQSLPLGLEDSSLMWQASGIQHLVLLENDPADFPHWLHWAGKLDIKVYTFA